MGKKPPFASDIEAARYPPPPPPTFHMPQPRQWIPWLVPLIFLANVAMFVYTMYLNDCPSYLSEEVCLFHEFLGRFSFQPFRENPLLGPSIRTLRVLGALERDLVVDENEAWRFFTCMFLHAGVVHLLANMFSLLFIGVRLEKEFGFVRIVFLYMLSGFGGSLLSILDLKESQCAALISLIVIIGLNLAVGFLPHVDNSAHIGGFLAGFFLGFVLLMRPQYGYVSRRYIPS